MKELSGGLDDVGAGVQGETGGRAEGSRERKVLEGSGDKSSSRIKLTSVTKTRQNTRERLSVA